MRHSTKVNFIRVEANGYDPDQGRMLADSKHENEIFAHVSELSNETKFKIFGVIDTSAVMVHYNGTFYDASQLEIEGKTYRVVNRRRTRNTCTYIAQEMIK